MNSIGTKLEELVEKTHQAASDEERKTFAHEASELHKKITGLPMIIDDQGHIQTNNEEAKKCPKLH
ncbi:uncharacterized protein BX663DRAFT_554661 [Cokeromyces recurvatus]|uniref:uncharacterized protein n=1 Tax=Cokeromyces recurvatus TaxID=90255 RepID=UPI00221EE6B2|nr:uncharacterized protein BX663DRAFT_554661 [Cokeromyces recurvatus]KAI7899704.1 hypothetical protein BX663DRAFT_554661 [Cokeromyces recurvatus]